MGSHHSAPHLIMLSNPPPKLKPEPVRFLAPYAKQQYHVTELQLGAARRFVVLKQWSLEAQQGKSLQRMRILINNFKARPTLPGHLPAGSGAVMKTWTGCFANTFQRNELCPQSAMRKLEWFKTDWITDQEKDWDSKHPQRCFINHSSALRFELESATA